MGTHEWHLNVRKCFTIFGYSFVHLQVIKFKDHKDPLVRKTTISLVPVLAGFNPPAFNLSHLQPWATYMLAVMKKEKGPERSAAFLGMALALRHDSTRYL